MVSSTTENLSAGRDKAIGELLQGRELANQLRLMLVGKPPGMIKDGDDEPKDTAEDLVEKIMNSFSGALSVLNSGDFEEVSQAPATESPCWDGRKSEDSGESTKSSTSKDRRGCYKRRKSGYSWSRLTPTLVDDGHAWRKYGQKPILNATYPRNYFRCTHKHDQGCQATKQVQRTSDNPPMFKITYHGHHTCKNLLLSSPHHQIILDDSPPEKDSSVILNFQTETIPTAGPQRKSSSSAAQTAPIIFSSSSSFPMAAVKQELLEGRNQSPSSGCAAPPDQVSAFVSDHHQAGDMISGVYSSSAINTHRPHEAAPAALFDMDLMTGSACFDDFYSLNFDGYGAV